MGVHRKKKSTTRRLSSQTVRGAKRQRSIPRSNPSSSRTKTHKAQIPGILERITEKIVTLKNVLERIPGVQSASVSSAKPSRIQSGYTAFGEGLDPDHPPLVTALCTDEDFVRTMNLTLLAGPGFPPITLDDGNYYYMVNETALARFGWTVEDAIGREFNLQGGRPGRVVGVVRDFNFRSLHQQIGPLVLFNELFQAQYLLIKVQTPELRRLIMEVEKAWNGVLPHRPFEFTFLDDELNTQYAAERRVSTLMGTFSGLAILIACIGLFALAAHAMEKRTKEIGIRKVLGATAFQLVGMLNRDFVVKIVIAMLVAWPVGFYLADYWLDDFAYRIEISIYYFLTAASVSLLVSVVVVTYHGLKAALANPVDAIRAE